MTLNRRIELIRAEALWHCSLARLEESGRQEHLEVAEALHWAAMELEKNREKLVAAITSYPPHPQVKGTHGRKGRK